MVTSKSSQTFADLFAGNRHGGRRVRWWVAASCGPPRAVWGRSRRGWRRLACFCGSPHGATARQCSAVAASEVVGGGAQARAVAACAKGGNGHKPPCARSVCTPAAGADRDVTARDRGRARFCSGLRARRGAPRAAGRPSDSCAARLGLLLGSSGAQSANLPLFAVPRQRWSSAAPAAPKSRCAGACGSSWASLCGARARRWQRATTATPTGYGPSRPSSLCGPGPRRRDSTRARASWQRSPCSGA